MTIYKHEQNNQFIIFNNDRDTILQVNTNVIKAIESLKYHPINNYNDGRLKLVIWHGDIPNIDSFTDYPVVFLRMSSEGLSNRPMIYCFAAKNICVPAYFVQGGAGSPRIPKDEAEWGNLIDWLLKIEEKKWNENDEAPLPDVPDIRKFIYTEPYPDALVACYLAMVANEQTLSEELKKEAEEDYKKLRAKHGPVEGTFDEKGIKELFVKMAKT